MGRAIKEGKLERERIKNREKEKKSHKRFSKSEI